MGPGHQYRFGLNEGEAVWKWKEGTREEVMSPPGNVVGFGTSDGPGIVLAVAGPLEFDVVETEAGSAK